MTSKFYIKSPVSPPVGTLTLFAGLLLSAMGNTKHRPFELFLRSRGQSVSKRPSSQMGGAFDLVGVHPV